MKINVENLEDKSFVRFYSLNNVIDFISDNIYLKVYDKKIQLIEELWVSVYFNKTNQKNSNVFEYTIRNSCSKLIFEFSGSCKNMKEIKCQVCEEQIFYIGLDQ